METSPETDGHDARRIRDGRPEFDALDEVSRGARVTDHEALAGVRARIDEAEMRAENLERALTSNRRIGMAIGILMTRRGLTDEQAFDCLRQASQRDNIKLRDVAETVIYTGDV
jgi:hypothetical protein